MCVPSEWVSGSESLVGTRRTVHASRPLLLVSLSCLSLFFFLPSNFLHTHTDFATLRVNVGCGPAEERVLLTGLHAVADIYCENCKTTLGWKYVSVTWLV